MHIPEPLLDIAVIANPRARRADCYSAAQQAILSLDAGLKARNIIATWPNYEATPLRSLHGLAQRVGVGHIHYKDESSRFGLGSFKALGGAYAVYRLVSDAVRLHTGGGPLPHAELLEGCHQEITSRITVCCATDGNHGRSVAWGARSFGCACVIFLHAGVSQAREDAIAAYGARIVRTLGNYDDSVRAAAQAAEEHGWTTVSDTSYTGYTDIPRHVMQGYSVMLIEAEEQSLNQPAPTHVFVQGGVGGLAAAVCAHLWERRGAARPLFVVVEPDAAACLGASARAGYPVPIHGDLGTVMAGLACGEVSLLAWEVLATGADFFLTISDASALSTMRLLAASEDDGPVVAGESGAAGLAGLLAACGNDQVRKRLGLDATSSILVIGTEGDTDPDFYVKVIGEQGHAS